MTLSDPQGQSSIASFFKLDFSYRCASVDKISADMTRLRGPSATAELLVTLDVATQMTDQSCDTCIFSM